MKLTNYILLFAEKIKPEQATRAVSREIGTTL